MNYPSLRQASLRLALVAGLALPLGFGPMAMAQGAPPPAPPAAGMHEHHWDPAQRRAMMAAHLTAILQLQPGQQAALDAFLDSMKPPADHEGMDREHGMDEHLTTPQRLDRMERRMDEMRARFEAHAAAVKTFYAQLTPAQQAAFDALAPMMMRHMGGHDGEGHHGWGDHGGMDGRHHPDGDDHGMGPDGPPHG